MKKIIITLIIVIALIISLIFIFNKPDNLKFKNDFEKYNDITVPENNNVKYVNFDEVKTFLKEGTGILYLGYPECKKCRLAIPVLLKAAEENEIEEIYYFNTKDISDKKELKNGKVITTKKGTDEYNELTEKLDSYLEAYTGLNDNSIKRIYFPATVFVMGGKIVGVHSTSKDFSSKEFKQAYNDNIQKIYGVCDKEKSC